jgi:peroxiredoxin
MKCLKGIIRSFGNNSSLFHAILIDLTIIGLFLTSCGISTTAALPTAADSRPEWFGFELTDVQTGETFTMNDFAGKVVLLETMAMWCPNCTEQANEVRNLHNLLGNPEDLVSVSLDVDINEDAASLGDYVRGFGFDWHFAVAPLEVARALGNLYTAQYLNPPLSPMMIIDRNGAVHHLEYGLKKTETLREIITPYLDE